MNFEEPLKDYVLAVQSIKVHYSLLPSVSRYGFTFFVKQCIIQHVSQLRKLTLHFLPEQATIAERGNAFRHQCQLAETVRLKEINL